MELSAEQIADLERVKTMTDDQLLIWARERGKNPHAIAEEQRELIARRLRERQEKHGE